MRCYCFNRCVPCVIEGEKRGVGGFVSISMCVRVCVYVFVSCRSKKSKRRGDSVFRLFLVCVCVGVLLNYVALFNGEEGI